MGVAGNPFNSNDAIIWISHLLSRLYFVIILPLQALSAYQQGMSLLSAS
jgi:hypothetical protein